MTTLSNFRKIHEMAHYSSGMHIAETAQLCHLWLLPEIAHCFPITQIIPAPGGKNVNRKRGKKHWLILARWSGQLQSKFLVLYMCNLLTKVISPYRYLIHNFFSSLPGFVLVFGSDFTTKQINYALSISFSPCQV